MVVDEYHDDNHYGRDDYDKSHARLTNDDFRKLLTTKKSNDARKDGSDGKKRVREDGRPNTTAHKTEKKFKGQNDKTDHVNQEDFESYNSKRKRKLNYAKVKKEEEEREKELAAKYRDRAKERREGDNPDYQSVDLISASSGYKAVAPDAKTTEGAAERRKQMIQESKFLGGDMEHTHLVKGLDYALLQKVRSEIVVKEKDDDFDDESAPTKASQAPIKKGVDKKAAPSSSASLPQTEDLSAVLGNVKITGPLAKNVCRAIYCHKVSHKNELFGPRRMAYVIDLEDEYADTDIPTTLLRSKADCPLEETQATLTTNDIVINKLTQILSYLRQGVRGNVVKKSKKKDPKPIPDMSKLGHHVTEDSIYGDIGEYVPALVKVVNNKAPPSSSSHHRAKIADGYKLSSSGSYFTGLDLARAASAAAKEVSPLRAFVDTDDTEHDDDVKRGTLKMVREINQKYGKKSDYVANEDASLNSVEDKDKRYMTLLSNEEKATKMNKLSLAAASNNTYAECYPGYVETMEAVYDSEDEVDFTKMDLGNKKGPVGRWDFDTQEEYSTYMSNKEALPKAAFQYGVKMSDGRKTRRAGPKDEKMKLDQEWQKISKIIQKRKDDKTGK